MLRLALMMALTFSLSAVASPKAKTVSPQESAQSWLKLIDNAKYEQSWNESAALFKSRITAHLWADSLKSVRTPLGKVISRKLKSSTPASTLPGAPDGEYVVIEFSTEFKNKKSAVETVTPMKDADGKWHVSGYFIK